MQGDKNKIKRIIKTSLGTFLLILGFYGSLMGFQVADRDPDHMIGMIFTDQVELALGSNEYYKTGGLIKDPKLVWYRQYYVGQYTGAAMMLKNQLRGFPSLSQGNGFKRQKGFDVLNSADFNNMSFEQKKEFADWGNALGILQQTMGDYTGAENMLNKCMSIRKDLFGTKSKTFLNSLFNLSILYVQVGNYGEAENLLNYLDRSFKSVYGENSTEYALLRNNIGMLYANLGRNEEALKALNQAIKIGEVSFNPKYIDLERVMVNKALILEEKNELAEARILYEKAMAGFEEKNYGNHPGMITISVQLGKLFIKTKEEGALEYIQKTNRSAQNRYGDNHPLYAMSRSNEGDFYMENERYDEAYSIYEEVAEIQRTKLGETHAEYLNTLSKMAICQWQLGNLAMAKTHFQHSIKQYLFLVDQTFRSMSETEKSKFWQTLKPRINAYMSFAVEASSEEPELLIDIYNLHIQTKGLLISSSNSVKNNILSSGNEDLIALYDEWLNSKEELSYYYSSSLEVAETDGVDIKELEIYTNDLEKQLSIQSSAFSADTKEPATYSEIKSALGEGEGAMEIIRITPPIGKDKDVVQYIGLLVKSDSEKISLLRIDDGKLLESRGMIGYKNSIKFKLVDETSYDIFWSPFTSDLTGLKNLYISVDGAYNLINLNTLVRNGHYLLDDLNLILLSNTKYISDVKNKLITFDKDGENTLFGFPQFGDENLVPPLPGTETELLAIDSIMNFRSMNANLFMQKEASKDNLLATHSPDILHIATHGFFLKDVSSTNSMFMGIQVGKAKLNPLLRSGLMLSGAANAFKPDETAQTGQKGIINAYEVMNMDLSNTKLVVLSACETGTGEVVNGEGVYGLPRAFQVAGADAIIMSLWKVDDAATNELMSIFYDHMLASGDVNLAFIEAQKGLREKYNHPYYWGAFVLLN